MNDQAQQHRIALVRVHELIVMSFFTKVEVRRNRVLEKMSDKVAQQNQERRAPAAQFQTFRDHFHQSGSQHKSRAQRDEVTQITPLPIALDYDRTAEYIGGRSGQAEKNAG